MAVVTNLEALAVFEAMFSGRTKVLDPIRQEAQQEIRRLAHSRIYRGRKIEGIDRSDTILLSVAGNQTEMLLSGEDDCTDTLVLVRCLSNSDFRASLMLEAVRQLLTAYKGIVETPAGEVVIGGIFPEDKDSPEPEPPDDGSPWFDFEYNAVYRVLHSQVSPEGVC
jgi:hypothetical protein